MNRFERRQSKRREAKRVILTHPELGEYESTLYDSTDGRAALGPRRPRSGDGLPGRQVMLPCPDIGWEGYRCATLLTMLAMMTWGIKCRV